MPPVDWVTLSRFVPELILSVVFGWFVLQIIDRQDKRDEKRDIAFAATLTKIEDQWRDHLAQERVLDRESRSASTVRIAEEIKNLSVAVALTNALVTKHDEWERGAMERGQARVAA